MHALALRLRARPADKKHERFGLWMVHKLLLADDSVTIQRVIELTFADEDVEVTTVGDGQMAIDRLDADPPDIILADVDMPKRDGYEVAAYVKSRPKLAHIPVVLLTGAFEPIDQARAAAAGSSDVLAKPFEPQMVINRVKELLGKKRPDDDGVGDPQPANRQPAGEGAQSVSLDDYFDQLDAAFSNLQPAAPPADASDDGDWVASAPPLTSSPAVTAPSATVDIPAPKAPVAIVSTFSGSTASAFAHNAPADKPIITKLQDAPGLTDDASAGIPIASAVAPPPPIAVAERPSAPSAPIAPVAPVIPVTTPGAPVTSTFAAAPPVAPVATVPTFAAHAPASTFAEGATADKPAAKPVAPTAPTAHAPVAPITTNAPVAHSAPPVAPIAPVAQSAPVAPVAPSVAPKPATNPFATLSAAKAEAAARPVPPVVTEEMIEDIVARVLQRLTDRVVRETVTEIVSKTAERLVQDEIEKIKLAGE
jgi:CheY-like chemotaxis protein